MFKQFEEKYIDFKNQLTQEEYYEYLIYSSRPLGGYFRDFEKYKKENNNKSYKNFVKYIIENKKIKYYEAFKFYLKNRINKEIKFVKEYDIKIIHIDNKIYPKRLLTIKNPSRFLFYRGDLSFYIKSIAIVGTRKFDNSASEITNYFAQKMVEHSLVIVSGNAKGVDLTAQYKALKSNGKIVIVLGVGLGFFLNSKKIENKNILLLTEFPLFFKGNRQSFPIRNRIIAGVALGTIMIQAPKKSGALYTANYTLEQNKPLFVPPGEIFNENYEGNFELLKRKDKNIFLLTKIDDILDVFHISKKINKYKEKSRVPLDKFEEKIAHIISEYYPQAINLDKLYFLCQEMKFAQFQIKLFTLLINDIVEELPGKNYIFKSY